jgi:predicted acetyltransferase
MTIDVRRVQEDEFNAWSDAIDIGFNTPRNRGQGVRRRRWSELERCWGAFDGGRPVGTFRGIGVELTVPGGAAVPMDAVAGVTVAPTHRRRGLLSRMMAGELGAARERGESLAGLYAAEYPIYGRYGFGPAVESASWHLDARAARWTRELPGTVELADLSSSYAEAADLYDQVRATAHGAISRTTAMWERALDLVPLEDGDKPDKSVLNAFCRDADGRVVGYVRYKFVDDSWTNQRPSNTVEAFDLYAVNVEYEARLWQYLADHDWVAKVTASENRRFDELWRELLVNRRAAWSTDHWEGEWIRVLDPVAALSARRYEVPGRLVLRIADKDGYADGTFLLEGGPDGATCAPTTESPDVTLPASVLGSVYLGGFSAARFAVLGLLDEERPGAVARFASMFHTALAPWSATDY